MVGRPPRANAQGAAANAQGAAANAQEADGNPQAAGANPQAAGAGVPQVSGGAAALRGQETRQRLLAAAVALVQEVGWGAVSTRAIAQRAGVRPGVVHYHFPSVTDLLVDATVPALAGMIDEIAALLEDAADLPAGIDALLAMVAGYAADYAADEPEARLTAEAFLAAARVPRLRTELATVLARARTLLADWLRRHGYRGDADPVSAVVVATLDGLVLHRAVDQRLDLAGVSAVLRAVVGDGVPGGGARDDR